MAARQTLEELAELFAAEPELEAATIARAAGRNSQQESRVLNLAADAEAFFRDAIRTQVLEPSADWALKPLDPIYKGEADTVEWVRLDDVEAVRLAVDRFSNLGPLQPFQPGDDAYIKRLLYRTYVLTGADGRKAFFFRAFSAAAELQRKRGAAVLVSKDGAFTKVEERLFLFDDRIDSVVFGDYVYVLRKPDYRRIFDQLEAVRREARKAAAALHEKVPIANFDAFADACASQAGLADKLLAVQCRPYFARLSYEMLEPVIREFSLHIPVEDRGGKPHLVFKTEPDHRWRILRLVDDDYLRSSMTDELYEVNSKGAPPS